MLRNPCRATGRRMPRGLLVQGDFTFGRLPVASRPLLTVQRNAPPGKMKRMGIEAPYRKPNTSKPVPGHMTFPNLLR